MGLQHKYKQKCIISVMEEGTNRIQRRTQLQSVIQCQEKENPKLGCAQTTT